MAKRAIDLEQIHRVAREKFGYHSLRPGQAEAIQSALAGRDTLSVLPTGLGKSAIYQIAAYLEPGPTVVVSPLIALQRDQLAGIAQRNASEAAAINSTMSSHKRQDAMHELLGGDLEFLFLAPEQFRNPETLEQLKAAGVSLFVVDEAHCISEWGHDFRPDYLRLGAVIEELGHPTVIALTATAAPPVRDDIAERLRMRSPHIITRGFDRPNIWLGVESYRKENLKTEALLKRVIRHIKPGIVYVATRKHAEQLAEELRLRGQRATHYHGGLNNSHREQAYQAFMAGEADVIVATNAFGMGVDKPDVRFVFHYDIPDSLDAYYQEVGRAGRDGQLATALLLYRKADLNLHKFFAGGGKVNSEQIEGVLEAVQAETGPVAPAWVQKMTGLSKIKVNRSLNVLEDIGALELLPTGEAVANGQNGSPDQVARDGARLDEEHRRYRADQLESMREYAELPHCRRRHLLQYFGEELGQDCDYCDNCGVVLK